MNLIIIISIMFRKTLYFLNPNRLSLEPQSTSTSAKPQRLQLMNCLVMWHPKEPKPILKTENIPMVIGMCIEVCWLMQSANKQKRHIA